MRVYIFNIILSLLFLFPNFGIGQNDAIIGVLRYKTAKEYILQADSFASVCDYDSAAYYYSKSSRCIPKKYFPKDYCYAMKRAGWAFIVSHEDSTFLYHDSLLKVAGRILDTSKLPNLVEYCHIEYYVARNQRLRNNLDASISMSVNSLKRLADHPDSLSRLVSYYHLKNIANSYQSKGITKKAIRFNKKCLDYLSEKDYLNHSKIFSNLGSLYIIEENFEYAILFLEMAIAIWKKDSGQYISSILANKYNLLNIYNHLGDYKMAQVILTDYLNLIETHNVKSNLSRYDSLTFNIIKSRPNIDSVIFFQRKRLKYSYTHYGDSSSIYYDLYSIGKSFFSKDVDSSHYYLSRALSYVPIQSDIKDKHQIAFNLARAKVAKEDFEGAISILLGLVNETGDQSKGYEGSISSLSDEVFILDLLSFSYYKKYKTSGKPILIDSSIYYSNQCLSSFVKLINLFGSFGSNINYLSFMSTFARRRGDVLYEMYSINSISPESFLAHITYLKEISNYLLLNRNSSENLVPHKNQRIPETINYGYHNFVENIQELISLSYQVIILDSISKARPFVKNDHYLSVQKIKSIVHSLSNNSILIDYFLTNNSVLISTLTSKGIHIHEISVGVKCIKNQIDKTNEKIFDPISTYSDFGSALYNKLFTNIIDTSYEKVFIIPDGIIYRLPFELIPFYTKAGEKYCVELFSIGYSTSLKKLIQPREKEFEIDFLGFYNGDDTINALEELKYAKQELLQISDLFKKAGGTSKVWSKIIISPELNDMLQSKVIHISSHLISFTSIPGNSFIGDMKSWDGNNSISLVGISRMSFNNDLIFINSCSSFKGASYYSFGNRSFSTAFYERGISNVIAAEWNVPDKLGKEFSISFYSKLIKGYSYLEALSETKRDFIKNEAAPFIWGSFRIFTNLNQHASPSSVANETFCF